MTRSRKAAQTQRGGGARAQHEPNDGRGICDYVGQRALVIFGQGVIFMLGHRKGTETLKECSARAEELVCVFCLWS